MSLFLESLYGDTRNSCNPYPLVDQPTASMKIVLCGYVHDGDL